MTASERPGARPRRQRTDRLTTAWILAALATSALTLTTRGVLPQPLWTSIHVLTLGVLTSSVLQWSWYFTRALLHLPSTDRRSGRDATVRMVAFHTALVWLVAAMWTGQVGGTIVGAGAIGTITAWHGLALVRAARGRLAGRFAAVIRYYVAAAAFLVVGCILAGFLTVAMFDASAPEWLLAARDGLTLAHALVNLGGWIGLSIAGTVVTLGPTILRTRIDPGALNDAVAALPALVAGIVVAAAAAAAGWLPGVGIGLLAFTAAATIGIGIPLARTARAAGPTTFAGWTVGSGLGWTVLGIVAVAGNAFVATDAAALRDATLPWLTLLGAGGILQVLVGALSYLMPVVIGGGPGPVRAGMATLETAWPTRTALRNAALVLVAAGTAAGGMPLTPWWGLVLVAYVVDVALIARAGVRQSRARQAVTFIAPPPRPHDLMPTHRSSR